MDQIGGSGDGGAGIELFRAHYYQFKSSADTAIWLSCLDSSSSKLTMLMDVLPTCVVVG